MLNMDCPWLPTHEGCLELLRSVSHHHRIWLRRPACLTGSQRRRGLRYAQHGLPRATHSRGVFACHKCSSTVC